MIEFAYSAYLDRVLGAWLGKSIGGALGADVENHKNFGRLERADLWPPAPPANDDLDIQLVWLELMQEKGCFFDAHDLARYWQDRCWYNFCEYGFFLYNVQRGIEPPASGHFNNEFFRESEGCPIRSDIWGLISPGNPALAAEFARMDGELDHSGFSVETEMFYAAMTARAVAGGSWEELLGAGFSVLPGTSRIPGIVAHVKEISTAYPELEHAWRATLRVYGDRDSTKAATNLALMMLAWERSGGDFSDAMRHCVNFGWDTDCTAATLGGILGAWKGTQVIPEDWRVLCGEQLNCSLRIDHRYSTLTALAEETCRIGAEMALLRNPLFRLLDAPEIVVRPAPAPALALHVAYPEEPALYARQTTTVLLRVNNPYNQTLEGRLSLEVPAYVEPLPDATRTLLPGTTEIKLSFALKAGVWELPDKNLFRARMETQMGNAEVVFGLAGARQWLLYGPYWDMWDKTKHEECPYWGPGRNTMPVKAGCPADGCNHYVDLRREYLDEAALLSGEMGAAGAFHLESGRDLLEGADFGGWHGPAVYYLVREFRGYAGESLRINFGRSGQLRAWLDGELLVDSGEHHTWSLMDSDTVSVELDGSVQRLVVKLASPMDRTALSINFLRTDTGPGRPGVAYLADDLVDAIPESKR